VPTPTPLPTPPPTQRPATETPAPGDTDGKEPEVTPKATSKPTTPPTPKPTEPPKQAKTPYASSYVPVDVDFESGGRGISFDTTTLSGDSVSDGIFGRADITMVNIWTRT